MAHALLGASSSSRWLSCPPSARLGEMFPERKKPAGQFDAAAEGTTAHALAEVQLRRYFKQISAAEYNKAVEEIKASQYYSEEFQRDVDSYCLYVRSQVGDGDEIHFEERVDYSEWAPSGFGTSDVIIVNSHTIHSVDAKFGRVQVDAEGNSQLRLYCAGGYVKFKAKFPHIKHCKYTIVQPRLDHISSEEISLTELLSWLEDYVKPRAHLAWEGKGEFAPSDDACKYCRAKVHCRARSDFNNIAAAADFRKPETLSESELIEILKKTPSIKKWLTDVDQFLLDRATDEGVLPEGYALGKSQTKRKIGDEVTAAERLMDAGFKVEDIFEPSTLKSVAQLEKLGDKEHIQALLKDCIVRPEGEPKLVPAKKAATDDFS